MKQILIFILLLALFSCQPKKVADVVARDYKQDAIQLKGTDDFSVYGWFFLGQKSQYTAKLMSLIQYFPNSKSAKDQFILEYSTDNTISLQVYRNTSLVFKDNKMIVLSEDFATFSDKDYNQWIFIHISYSRNLRKVFAYFKFPSGDKTKSFEADLGDAAYERITLGNLDADLRNVYFASGQGSYRESYFKDILGGESDSTTFYDCPIAYQKCKLQGEGRRLCGEKEQIEVDKFQSLYIPNGKSVLVFETTVNKRKEKVYTKSINCVTSLDVFNLNFLEKQDKPKLKKLH